MHTNSNRRSADPATLDDMAVRDLAILLGYTLRIRGSQAFELYESPRANAPVHVGDKIATIRFLDCRS